jgi:replicative superfamily II helicase
MQMRKLEHARDIPDPSRRLPIGNLRILALSATAPNASDVAHWLGGVDHSFSANFRPVPLDYKVYSYTKPGNNGFAFEHSLNHRLFELIQRHSEGHPVLVFNSTRKNAEQAAKAIANAVVTDGKTRDYVSPDKVPLSVHQQKRESVSQFDCVLIPRRCSVLLYLQYQRGKAAPADLHG